MPSVLDKVEILAGSSQVNHINISLDESYRIITGTLTPT